MLFRVTFGVIFRKELNFPTTWWLHVMSVFIYYKFLTRFGYASKWPYMAWLPTCINHIESINNRINLLVRYFMYFLHADIWYVSVTSIAVWYTEIILVTYSVSCLLHNHVVCQLFDWSNSLKLINKKHAVVRHFWNTRVLVSVSIPLHVQRISFLYSATLMFSLYFG